MGDLWICEVVPQLILTKKNRFFWGLKPYLSFFFRYFWIVGQPLALTYKYTKREEFLRAMEKLFDYYIANCPSDYVPYWDFNDPAIPNTVRDSSAATITASGLLGFSGDKKFGDFASNILDSICKGYLAEEEEEGILKHGCFNKPEGKVVDESLIWGDYYFVEALTKVIYS